MTTLEWMLAAFAAVFVINVIPAFMPSTWMVIAFFLIAYKLPFWPLCFGGAVAATGGRCVLAYISARWGRRLLSAKQRTNVQALGDWLNGKSGWSLVLAVLVYSLGPIPSNQIFISAGLARVSIRPVALGFFLGRLVSYPIFAGGAKGVSDRIGDVLLKQWHNPKWVALEILSLVGVVVFGRIDWPKVLHLSVPSVKAGGQGATAQPTATGSRTLAAKTDTTDSAVQATAVSASGAPRERPAPEREDTHG